MKKQIVRRMKKVDSASASSAVAQGEAPLLHPSLSLTSPPPTQLHDASFSAEMVKGVSTELYSSPLLASSTEHEPNVQDEDLVDQTEALVKAMGENRGSQRLQALLHHFRTSKSIPNINNVNLSLDEFNAKPTKRAAVLICLFEDADGNLRVILTQRASSLSAHSGEVALPGGKRDEVDADDVATALREAKQEIGLDPSLVTAITFLEPFNTMYGITIIPVVGMLSDKDAFSPVLNPAEVAAIFDVPLELFLKNDNRRADERKWKGDKYLLHYFNYEVANKKYVIWAVTAAILIRAATIVLQRPPDFLEMRPEMWGGVTESDRIILQNSSSKFSFFVVFAWALARLNQ